MGGVFGLQSESGSSGASARLAGPKCLTLFVWVFADLLVFA